jgi:D-alanyl-lipoteichoic acid acyltransferase DltB (MBOAT superfamily)
VLFHSWIFLIFFAVVYVAYLFTKATRFRALWLLIASYVFYGWWNPLYLLLILCSTTVDYAAVSAMARTRWTKPCLFFSVACNLTLLGFFKYSGFVTENLNVFLGWLGVGHTIPKSAIVLPVGISFFVFRSMSYSIDFYRGKVEREPNFIRYATFVSFFPVLLAGPIERAGNLLPQLQQAQRITRQDITDGLSLFIVGLFKKIALADYLAAYVDAVYATPELHQAPALMLATFAFAWQIYFDFSGYTDMARGLARMMGIRLMLNFDNPYLATDLGDFWNRWHISLSTWFKDYVYIPLGGNRKGQVRTYLNMFLTMVISGLWHGAHWTFVAWGAVHAAGRVVTRELERTDFYRDHVPRCLKQAFVFIFVCFCWIFFRAESFREAWLIVERIFTSGFADPACPLLMLGLILSVWAYQFIYESRIRRVLDLAAVRVGLAVSMLLYIAFFGSSGNQAFIYFQF